MDDRRELHKELPSVMHAGLHAVAKLVLHVTGAARLEKSQRDAYTKQLKLLIEATDALP